jgi:cytochrome P450
MPQLIKLRFLQLFCRGLLKDTYRYETVSQQISNWRIQQKGDEFQDLYSSLLAARDPKTGNQFTQEQLIAEAGLLIVAGSDTMATAVSSVIFYVLHYPRTLRRLQEEIRKNFANVEEINMGSQMNSCEYLVACIDESMRLSPGVGAVLQREVLPGGLKVDGQWFPPGTDIAVPHYALHHNESYYNQPFEFIPERWLTKESSEADIRLARSAFVPFGVGRTSCVGKVLSYHEMKIMLARIIWLYDMRLQPGCFIGEGHETLGEGRTRKCEFQLWDSFVSTHEGPMVQFKPR